MWREKIKKQRRKRGTVMQYHQASYASHQLPHTLPHTRPHALHTLRMRYLMRYLQLLEVAKAGRYGAHTLLINYLIRFLIRCIRSADATCSFLRSPRRGGMVLMWLSFASKVMRLFRSPARQHSSTYVSVLVSIRLSCWVYSDEPSDRLHAVCALVSIRQHTSAY